MIEINTIKGWKQLQHQAGYINECTGQTLVVTKKQFSSNFYVMVFVGKRTVDSDGRVISPEFPTAPKAEAFAVKLMTKNPDGIV